jgi:hypothetical protein
LVFTSAPSTARLRRYAASLSSNFKLNFGVHDNNLFGIRYGFAPVPCCVAASNNFALSANYKQQDSSSSDAAFKPEKSVQLFPRRSKLPSTKRVTLKTITDTIVSLSHDSQTDLPVNSVSVLERFNVTGASGTLALLSYLLCGCYAFCVTNRCRRHQEVPQRL